MTDDQRALRKARDYIESALAVLRDLDRPKPGVTEVVEKAHYAVDFFIDPEDAT